MRGRRDPRRPSNARRKRPRNNPSNQLTRSIRVRSAGRDTMSRRSRRIYTRYRPRRMNDVTRILSAIEAGDAQAAEKLLPLVYDELRKLAAQKLANEKPGQTLQGTAL